MDMPNFIDPCVVPIAGVGACIVGGLIACNVIGPRRRRMRFVSRPILRRDEWATTYFPNVDANLRGYLYEVVQIIADELRVDLTQLKPEDDIRRDYLVRGACVIFDDTWDSLTTRLAEYIYSVRGQDITDAESDRARSWDTLADLVTDIMAMLSIADTQEGDRSA